MRRRHYFYAQRALMIDTLESGICPSRFTGDQRFCNIARLKDRSPKREFDSFITVHSCAFPDVNFKRKRESFSAGEIWSTSTRCSFRDVSLETVSLLRRILMIGKSGQQCSFSGKRLSLINCSRLPVPSPLPFLSALAIHREVTAGKR